MEELSNTLLDRLMYVLMSNDVPDLPGIKARFVAIMADYQINPKETAMVVYTEGKNEYFIKRFLLAKAVAGCTKQTIKQYDDDLHRTFREIGKDADTITALDIQMYLAQQMQRVSASTADNSRRYLSSFYGWCQREELIPKNPMSRVDPIKTRKQKKSSFSEMDVELIRNACRNNRERAIVETLLSTGCRVSELVTIRQDDLNGNSVDVLGKGEKHRNVYLNAKALLAIQSYTAERTDKNPYLFPKMLDEARSPERFGRFRKNGGDWYKNPDMVDCSGHADTGTIESIIRKLGKTAGVENCHPHRFRRTCATFALRRGMPIEQVSKLLGHEQLSTTQIYLDLSEEELQQAHRKYVV